MDHSGFLAEVISSSQKATDQAFGSTLADHVMAGYEFLMRYYSSGDKIYIFGFSRGAYTARFLAQMLDQVGLLSAGNEELQRFAWKTFSDWQARPGDETEENNKKTLELYQFMKGFRETFCRPISRIRMVGLFDTVNSVPRFENAWMQRTKYPYTATSSAEVIRHAVSIGERRAKFRVDLISGRRPRDGNKERKFHRYASDLPALMKNKVKIDGSRSYWNPLRYLDRAVKTSDAISHTGPNDQSVDMADATPGTDSLKPSRPADGEPTSMQSNDHGTSGRDQDVLEVWFSGNHGDIGGGWPKHVTETWPLSHAPLVWMVQEALKAGLKFDVEKLAALNCWPERFDDAGNKDTEHESKFHKAMHESTIRGFVHDCLEYGKGPGNLSVLSWNMMEYLPFRRMDLQANGKWKPIRWATAQG